MTIKYLYFSVLLALVGSLGQAQETFSIVAVDSATGKIGSAGASCLDSDNQEGGVYIITDVVPDKGAIHTQARYNPFNQTRARQKMLEGLSATELTQWLENNDATNDPGIRQYGVALFDSNGSPQTSAFTGQKTDSFKGQLVGPQYAIQGNILKGPEVLDSMKKRFLNTEGPFEDRLMAALQGGNMVGADRRCFSEGTSSLSAFIRVAKPNDAEDDLYLDLLVGKTPDGKEPIDSVQVLYDNWKTASNTEQKLKGSNPISLFPNPADDYLKIQVSETLAQEVQFQLTNGHGQTVRKMAITDEQCVISLKSLPQGLYFYQIRSQKSTSIKSGSVIIE